MYSSLSNMVIMLSPMIYRMLIYKFLLSSIIIISCFIWHNVPYQWKILPFELATVPRVFTALTKPILFLCHHKSFHIVIYLDDISVLVCSQLAHKEGTLLFVFLIGLSWFTYSFFKVCPLPHSDLLFLGVMFQYCPHVSIFTS